MPHRALRYDATWCDARRCAVPNLRPRVPTSLRAVPIASFAYLVGLSTTMYLKGEKGYKAITTAFRANSLRGKTALGLLTAWATIECAFVPFYYSKRKQVRWGLNPPKGPPTTDHRTTVQRSTPTRAQRLTPNTQPTQPLTSTPVRAHATALSVATQERATQAPVYDPRRT